MSSTFFIFTKKAGQIFVRLFCKPLFCVDRFGAVDEFDLTVGAVGQCGEGLIILRNVNRRLYSRKESGKVTFDRVRKLFHALFVELVESVGKRKRAVTKL